MAEEKKTKKVDELTEEIGKLTVIELSELVSTLQEKLGVSAMPVAAAAPAAAPAAAAHIGADFVRHARAQPQQKRVPQQLQLPNLL